MGSTPALDAAELCAAAVEQTGLDDFGSPTFRDGLERLIDGLVNEARLNEMGQAFAPNALLPYLVTRLQVVDWHSRNPEIAKGDIVAPIVLIGMGRTGTTILHDLLGQDPDNRIPRTWEVDRPSPPPETSTYDSDPRIEEVQAGVDLAHSVRPDLRAMHPMGARLGQECVRFTGYDFASVIFGSQYRLPSYLRWVTTEADMAPTYRWHRQFLQLLQWRHAGRWMLKSGAHLWALPALMAEYPDAVLVQTHRDPTRVVASLSSLFSYLRGISSDDASFADTAAEWAPPIVDALERSVDARLDGTIPPERVLDVSFAAYMRDPVAVVRSIYDHVGRELRPEVEGRIRTFLADNPRDKHGLHRYSFADTGLDAGELFERTARYCDFFDVERDV
jgi:hypothetical protein